MDKSYPSERFLVLDSPLANLSSVSTEPIALIWHAVVDIGTEPQLSMMNTDILTHLITGTSHTIMVSKSTRHKESYLTCIVQIILIRFTMTFVQICLNSQEIRMFSLLPSSR